MAALSTIAISALAVTAATGVYSAVEGRSAAGKAKREREKQFQAQQNISKVQERNARLKQLREERIKRASNVAGAVQAGGGTAGLPGTSGYQGAQAGLRTQMGAHLSEAKIVSGYQDIVGQTSKNIFDIGQDLQKKQATAKGVGAISGTIFQAAGGFSALKGTPSVGTSPSNTNYSKLWNA